MGTRGDRLERLIRQLETAEGPVPARALAAALHVTDRSIRSYVRQLNGAGERELIVSTPAGYRLDRRVLRSGASSPPAAATGAPRRTSASTS